ncbi:hypothetical protein E1301_Tti022047 [Triplophysa tibetana]|uniref:Uncharacterized protein n=1 Tax=Triplophysa tibetana TaxID=1572043 RepID=A0A5A9NT02_9TELE|nr:hypothetical protein E1301_Tti022047 [Triplophysa tibetana]
MVRGGTAAGMLLDVAVVRGGTAAGMLLDVAVVRGGTAAGMLLDVAVVRGGTAAGMLLGVAVVRGGTAAGMLLDVAVVRGTMNNIKGWWSTLEKEEKQRYCQEAAALRVHVQAEDLSPEMRDLRIKLHLKKLKCSDGTGIEHMMRVTFFTQRKDIISGMETSDLTLEWPYLFDTVGMKTHFKELTRMDIASKCTRVVSYFKYSDKRAEMETIFREMDTSKMHATLMSLSGNMEFWSRRLRSQSGPERHPSGDWVKMEEAIGSLINLFEDAVLLVDSTQLEQSRAKKIEKKELKYKI